MNTQPKEQIPEGDGNVVRLDAFKKSRERAAGDVRVGINANTRRRTSLALLGTVALASALALRPRSSSSDMNNADPQKIEVTDDQLHSIFHDIYRKVGGVAADRIIRNATYFTNTEALPDLVESRTAFVQSERQSGGDTGNLHIPDTIVPSAEVTRLRTKVNRTQPDAKKYDRRFQQFQFFWKEYGGDREKVEKALAEAIGKSS